jgi:YtkA-like
MAGIGTIAATACHRVVDAAPGISAKEEITPQPVRVGPATVSIELADQSQKPVAHAAIMVEADMSHPGMSPVFADAKEIGPGSYRAPIEFNMGGDWVLLLHIKLADGRKIERQMDVKGVRTN